MALSWCPLSVPTGIHMAEPRTGSQCPCHTGQTCCAACLPAWHTVSHSRLRGLGSDLAPLFSQPTNSKEGHLTPLVSLVAPQGQSGIIWTILTLVWTAYRRLAPSRPVGSVPTWHHHSCDWVSGFCWGPSYPCTCDPCSESGLHRTQLWLASLLLSAPDWSLSL